MFIKFLCDCCGHKLKAPPALAGRRAQCTHCSKAVLVPLPVAIPVTQNTSETPVSAICGPAPKSTKVPAVFVTGVPPLKNTVWGFWLGGVVTFESNLLSTTPKAPAMI
jgi:hypothetical protein